MVRSSCCNTGQVGSSSSSTGSSSSSSMQAQSVSNSSSYTAKAVACRFRAELQQQLQREWDRVEIDVRVGSGIPLTWLGGRAPVIDLVDFRRKWDGLYRVSRWRDTGRIVVKVSTAGL